MTEADKDLQIAELTVLLREARNFCNALWLDCMTSDIAEETMRKYKGMGARLNKFTKNDTAFSKDYPA